MSDSRTECEAKLTFWPLTRFMPPLYSAFTPQPSFPCLQRILSLIIHCFRRTPWIPIPSYCRAPSSRLIAAPKVINFIPGDVPTNVNDRRRLCFDLLAVRLNLCRPDEGQREITLCSPSVYYSVCSFALKNMAFAPVHSWRPPFPAWCHGNSAYWNYYLK